MNLPDLPEDLSTEESIRTLLRFAELGDTALERANECVHGIMDLADRLLKARPDCVALARDPWKSPFLNTLFDQRRYLYLKRVDYRETDMVLHMWERGCKGDADCAGEAITLPLSWLWASHTELVVALTAQMEALIAAHQAKLERQRLSAEAAERAQLAALKARYEGGQ